MKAIRITFGALIILSSALFGRWDILNEGVKGSLNTVDFVNENVGWLAGSNGLLLKTEDGGQEWLPIKMNEHWTITVIDFLNDSIGWAIGQDETGQSMILKTDDGGHSWSLQKALAGLYFNSLFVVSDSVVYVAGNDYTGLTMILKTPDSGISWVDTTPYNMNGQLESIWFFTDEVGFAAGYCSETVSQEQIQRAVIAHTENGGETWEENIIPDFSWVEDFQFIDDSTGCFFSRVQTQSSSYSMLCKTTDRLKSWSIITQSDDTNWINSFFYLGNGHFCSNNSLSASRIGGPTINFIAKSVDGGRTWEQKLPAGRWNLNQMFFINGQVGFSIGGGTILKTIDGGENWSVQTFSYSFENVCFIDRNKGFAGGGMLSDTHFGNGYGDMFVTADGGKTWQPNLSIDCQKIESCVFVNSSIGFAISRIIDGTSNILKTVDGGENW